MAVAALPRLRPPGEAARDRPRPESRQWRPLKVLALVTLALVAVTIPSGLVLGDVFAANVKQEATQLQAELRQAASDGVPAPLIQPLQQKLAAITVPGPWEEPGKARAQLDRLTQLRHELAAVYAAAVASERANFQKSAAAWTSLSANATGEGLTLEGLAEPVTRLRAIEAQATTPAGIRGVTGLVDTYTAQLADRLAAFTGAKAAANAELTAARTALESARSAGVDVSAYATSIEGLARQLAQATDAAAVSSCTQQLRAQKVALNGLLVVTINAPVYEQAMSLDCETSALRVGLAAYGFFYSDAHLFAEEPVDARPPVMGANHVILQWGNPYTHFVGNVNGSESIPTGYGVYYPVIVSLARAHGLPNAVGGEGYSPATIYAELRAHHPVEVWIEYNWTSYQRGTWTAWDGTKVRYTYGEHAVTLTGVSPTQVRVNDVAHGTQYWIDQSTFEASWSALNNMAVIFK